MEKKVNNFYLKVRMFRPYDFFSLQTIPEPLSQFFFTCDFSHISFLIFIFYKNVTENSIRFLKKHSHKMYFYYDNPLVPLFDIIRATIK